MKRVMVESPFASPDSKTAKIYKKYLEGCVFDCLERGEAPFASHGFYTQYLKDTDPMEREQGMLCGKAWAKVADVVAFYVNYGMSPGMLEMLSWAFKRQFLSNYPILEIRKLPDWFDEDGDSA